LIRNLDDQFLNDYTANLKKAAASKGVELKVMDARSDMATQLDQLNTLISQGVKYFVVVPAVTEGSEQLASVIAAKNGGAAFSNTAPTVKALKTSSNFFLASSPESIAGSIQADIVDSYFKKFPQKLGPGKAINLILFLGQLGHPAQIYRTQAVLKDLEKKGYKVNVIAKDTANWQPDEAQQKMDAWLNAYKGKFNLILANNDAMALGAVESLITAKYVDDPANPTKDVDGDGTFLKVPVIGVDATQVALRSMSENKLYATVLQDAAAQATTAFELHHGDQGCCQWRHDQRHQAAGQGHRRSASQRSGAGQADLSRSVQGCDQREPLDLHEEVMSRPGTRNCGPGLFYRTIAACSTTYK
jgi:methyl-galactoside transport system substrate-binding protein